MSFVVLVSVFAATFGIDCIDAFTQLRTERVVCIHVPHVSLFDDNYFMVYFKIATTIGLYFVQMATMPVLSNSTVSTQLKRVVVYVAFENIYMRVEDCLYMCYVHTDSRLAREREIARAMH